MASDALVYDYGRATRGSHTVLIHDTQLRSRAGVVQPGYTIATNPPYVSEEPGPVQSVGESSSSLRMKNFLESVMAGFTGLASDPPKQIRMTASPEARTANMDPWKVKNGRRIRLIEKKHREGLDEKETAELIRLKQEVSAHIQQIAPRSTKALEDFTQHVRILKEKAAQKKRQEP